MNANGNAKAFPFVVLSHFASDTDCTSSNNANDLSCFAGMLPTM
jgi:hypothetical protein